MGTFKQIVQAAEKCLAKCIHPPSAESEGIRPALVLRAALLQ
jgi:hypothetical protein